MKNLTLIDNSWVERKNPNITVEERAVMEDRSENNNEARQTLMEAVRSRSTSPADLDDAQTAQAIYDQHKIAGSNLIAADISLPGGNGIINCRVDGEHKQVRF